MRTQHLRPDSASKVLLGTLIAIVLCGIAATTQSDDNPPPGSSTNSVPVLLIGTNWQSFDHTPGVDQWFQFSLSNRSEVAFYTTNANLDTALLLYGPDTTNTLLNAYWPDYFSGYRLLDQSGANALDPGTYFFAITETTGGTDTNLFQVWHAAVPVETNAPPAALPAADPGAAPADGGANAPPDVILLFQDVFTPDQWLSFDHTPGVDQWFQITLSNRTALAFYAESASQDTAILLYGPDTTNTLLNAVWPDFFTGYRLLDLTAANALDTGTYYLAVIDMAGGLSSDPFKVYYAMTTATNSAPADPLPVFVAPNDTMPVTPLVTPDMAAAVQPTLDTIPQIYPANDWLSFDHSSGSTQWVQFTLTDTNEVSIYADAASFDTVFVLYGPDSTNLVGYALTDPLSGFCLLYFAGTNALVPGTYYLGVTELAGGFAEQTFSVWYRMNSLSDTTSNAPAIAYASSVAPAPAIGSVTLHFAENGNLHPIQGVGITIYSDSTLSSRVTSFQTDSNGRGTVTGIRGAVFYITLTKADAAGVWTFSGQPSVTIWSSPHTNEYRGTLKPFFTASGTAYDSSAGTPLQPLQGGYTVHFTNADFRPQPVNLPADAAGNPYNGRWSAGGFVTDYSYQATPEKIQTDGAWVFSPASLTFSSPSASLNFWAAFATNYQIKGIVTNSAGQGVSSGVQLSFQLQSSTGLMPLPVTTAPDGKWSKIGFTPGKSYKVVPSKPDGNGTWAFVPPNQIVSGQATNVNFLATFTPGGGNTYTLSGQVTNTLNGSGVGGVTMSFANYMGAPNPQSVVTDQNGNWRQSGFQKYATGTGAPVTYAITPSKANETDGRYWLFNPFNQFSTPTSTHSGLNFIGTAVFKEFTYEVVFAQGMNTNALLPILKTQFRLAANYFYGATDGQMIIRTITFLPFTQQNWDNASIRLTNGVGSFVDLSDSGGRLYLNVGNSSWTIYQNIVHEIGHLDLFLYDEYTAYRICNDSSHIRGVVVNGVVIDHNTGDSVNKNKAGHSDLGRTCSKCIMDRPNISKFCIAGNHNYGDALSGYNAQQENNHEPCWATIKRKFPNLNLTIPTNLQLPGPGDAANGQPLPETENVARHVIFNGP